MELPISTPCLTAIVLGHFLMFLSTSYAEDIVPLRVGVLTELSGPAAAIATDCRHGLETGQAAFSQNNKAEIQLFYGDTRDDAATAVTEFRKLVQTDKAEIVIVTRSKTALPVNPVAAELHIPLVGGVGHPDYLKGNPNAVRLFPSTFQEGSYLADAAVRLKLKRIAIVTLEDDWTLSLTEMFTKAAVKNGIEIVSDQRLVPTDRDFATTTLKIRQSKPDAIFVNVLLGQAGALVKKIREAGLRQRLLSNYWIQKEETVQAAGESAVEGALFSQVDTNKPKFTSLFQAKFPGEAITPANYLCYAAVATVAYAASVRNGNELSAGLIADHSLPLLDDELQFLGREAQLTLVLKTLKAGKVVNFVP